MTAFRWGISLALFWLAAMQFFLPEEVLERASYRYFHPDDRTGNLIGVAIGTIGLLNLIVSDKLYRPHGLWRESTQDVLQLVVGAVAGGVVFLVAASVTLGIWDDGGWPVVSGALAILGLAYLVTTLLHPYLRETPTPGSGRFS